MVSSAAKMFMRVMHDSFGLPLISTEQLPHLPALQFQRSARSFACCAWMRWRTSSTTMPGSTSTSKVLKSPPAASPRHTRNVRLLIVGSHFAGLEVLDLGVRDLFELRRRVGSLALLDLHAIRALLDDDVVLQPLLALAREVVARVSASALLAHERGAGDDLRRDQQRLHRQRLVPARVVLAGAGRL